MNTMKREFYLKISLILGLGYLVSFPIDVAANSLKEQDLLQVSEIQQIKRSISGTVTDESGEALIGVSVTVKQSTNGTITDENGKYRIDVAPGETLIFSYTGFKPSEYKIDSQRTIDVVLGVDSKLLEEVVVTGYQTLSRERATGSFDRVGSELLAARPSSDISSALQGLVPGMKATESLDGSVSFVIRGASTLYADKAPLLVVDGFPIQGSFNSINPNDVESVTILKDAAAASIWGARSANGVIVITTKKGTKDKLKIDVQGFYRFATKPNLDDTWALADSRTQVNYELDALKNGWILSGEYSPSFGNIRKGLTLAQELYYANKYLGLSEADMNAGLDRLRNTNNTGQIEDYLLQTQAVQQYNVSVSGGNERSTSYLSLMYEKRDENTIKRGYDRYLVNFNNTYRLSPSITVYVSANLQKKDIDNSGLRLTDFVSGELPTENYGAAYGQSVSLSPYEMLLNEDGTYAPNIIAYNRYEQSQLPLDKFPYEDWSFNFLREIRGRDYKTEELKYRLQGGLNIKLIDGLTYDTRIQYESSSSETKNFDSEDTYYVRNMVNTMTEYNSATKVVGVSRIPKGGIERSTKRKYYNYVFRNQVNFDKTLLSVHDISVVGGIEVSEYNQEWTRYPYIYGYDRERSTTTVPPYGYGGSLDPFKDFTGATASVDGGGTAFTHSRVPTRVDRYLSYYGNAGYTYDGKYNASFSIRADGSNFVSEDASLRWSPMWSLGGKWNAKQEKFLKSVSWINRLSPRITYGINGNAETSTSPQTLISMGSTVSNITNTVVSTIGSFGNPKLRWEKTYTTNLGVDFGLFKFLSGKIEYYNRKSKDVIGLVSIASAHGTTSQKINNAEILNRGVELELTANLKIPQIDLGISSTVIYAYNKNEITKLYNPSLYAYELVESTTFVEGRPVGSIHSYQYAGTEDGVPYVYGVDGAKNSMNDLALHNRTLGLSILNYSGTTVSPHTFGWTNKISYKGFSLYAFFTGNFGGVFRAPTLGAVPAIGGNKLTLNRYIKDFYESDGSLRPTLPLAGETGFYRWDRYVPNLEYYVEDASFIRLKEVSLEYDIPKALLQKLWIKNAKVFAQARDLGLIYTANKYGYDPEWLPGKEKPSTTITFGANLSF